MILLRILVWIELILSLSSVGVAQTFTSDLEEKYRIERSISERLEQTLKTRLEKNLFDITVEVNLRVITGPSMMSQIDNLKSKIPAELNTPEQIQQWYAQEVSFIGVRQKSRIEIESLLITLGLSDRVEANYRADLDQWLKQWSKGNFGDKAQAQVIIRPSANDLAKDSMNENSWLSWISKLQNLIGFALLAITFAWVYFFQNKLRREMVIPPNLNLSPPERQLIEGYRATQYEKLLEKSSAAAQVASELASQLSFKYTEKDSAGDESKPPKAKPPPESPKFAVKIPLSLVVDNTFDSSVKLDPLIKHRKAG